MIVRPLRACAMAVMLCALGVMTVEGQSVEPLAVRPPATPGQPLSYGNAEDGNAEKAPMGSWDRPAFLGNPKNMGSPYVPMDSWIYPAFDRLIALGYVRSAIVSQRPWTRLECTRLLNEADDLLQSTSAEGDDEASGIHDALAQEFSHERALLTAKQTVVCKWTQFTPASRELPDDP